MTDLKETVKKLIKRENEEEWFEFKENWYDARKTVTLGELMPGWWGERRYESGEDS